MARHRSSASYAATRKTSKDSDWDCTAGVAIGSRAAKQGWAKWSTTMIFQFFSVVVVSAKVMTEPCSDKAMKPKANMSKGKQKKTKDSEAICRC